MILLVAADRARAHANERAASLAAAQQALETGASVLEHAQTLLASAEASEEYASQAWEALQRAQEQLEDAAQHLTAAAVTYEMDALPARAQRPASGPRPVRGCTGLVLVPPS